MLRPGRIGRRNQRKKRIPLASITPNLITLSGLGFGLFAIKYAIHAQWNAAVACIVFASIIDGLDGRVARILNASSRFGAELDSLADFLNFAIAPAFITYLWLTHEVKGAGWGVSLFFIMCGAIRLARFNAIEIDKVPPASSPPPPEQPKPREEQPPVYGLAGVFRGRFMGMPSPAAGILSLMPLMIVFFQQDQYNAVYFKPAAWHVIAYIACLGLLMVSRVPTLSLKGMRVPQRYMPLTLALCCLVMICLLSEPWLAMPVMAAFYISSVAVTWIHGIKRHGQ